MKSHGKTLVTGSAGFIGSHLVERLVEKGDDVVCMVFDKDKINYLSPELMKKAVIGDVRDYSFVKKAMAGCDKVYHLAAALNAPSVSEQEFFSTNVEGTRNVMKAALELGVKKVVHTSSAVTIKETAKRVNEENIFRGKFDGPYSFTKFKGEKIAFEYGARGLEVVVVNPTLVYGPRGAQSLGGIFKNYLEPPIRFVGFKNSVLNLIYVKDVVEGFILAMEKGKPGNRYLLGGGEVRLGEFVRLMDEITGTRKPVIVLPEFVLQIGVTVAVPIIMFLGIKPPIMKAQVNAMIRGSAVDISKAKKELGLPDRPLRDGLKETLDWYRNTGHIRI
jgi:dihydroflavonol-4-reductase